MMNYTTYAEAVSKAEAYKALGQTEIYLDRDSGSFPWHLVVSVEEGGSCRLDMSTSVRFIAECPDSGLSFRWHFDIEDRSANGKGHYEINIDGVNRVTESLSGSALIQWRRYLETSARKVRAKGNEWMDIAAKQLGYAAVLSDLASKEKGTTA